MHCGFEAISLVGFQLSVNQILFKIIGSDLSEDIGRESNTNMAETGRPVC